MIFGLKIIKSHFKVKSEDGKMFKSKTILFATGSKWRKLGVPGEEEFANKGVHYCALCDSFAYKNKVTAIIGGSDTAAKDALVLAQAGKKVYMIYRGEKIRPEHVNLINMFRSYFFSPINHIDLNMLI